MNTASETVTPVGVRTLPLPPWVTGHSAYYGDTGRHGPYRYTLVRAWGHGGGTVNWIMLNPSTATHERDDPTIRRCTNFARAWGYSRLVVTNLFAFRATDPAALRQAVDPVGPENDWHLEYAAAFEAQRVVLAWGAQGTYRDRAGHVLALLTQRRGHAPLLRCLGMTKDGHPRHPLYVPASTPLQPYTPPVTIEQRRRRARPPRCPQCGAALTPVTYPSGSMLNPDQWASVRAGDWYCTACPPNGRGNTPVCYWWQREVVP